jgi:hypothetical protein
MRYFAAVLCCALFSTTVLVSVPASPAQACPAFGYSGEAVVEEAYG